MPLTEDEKATVLSLVHAHVSNKPEYSSWVSSYSTIRKAPKVPIPPATPQAAALLAGDGWRRRTYTPHCYMLRIGGHYRRKALYRKLLQSLKCTCKFEDVSQVVYMTPPLRAARRRWDEDGAIIPVAERQLEWF